MDMRKRLVVANWKMHLNVEEALKLVNALDKKVSASTKTEVVICPSFPALATLAKKLAGLPKFKLGAQNAFYQDEGAYTGEVSASQLRGLAEYVIVGHSERRLQFGETNDMIARKVSAIVRNGLVPILCVGENLFERQDGETSQLLQDQLTADLVMLTSREVARTVIAYEPVWAVDSNDIATPEQVKDAIKTIRRTLAGLYGEVVAQSVRILYGGHMEPEFAASYFSLRDLDGFLVGRASLNYQEFATIVKAAQRSRSPNAMTVK